MPVLSISYLPVFNLPGWSSTPLTALKALKVFRKSNAFPLAFLKNLTFSKIFEESRLSVKDYRKVNN
jgi:hypothetical protein